MVTKLSTSGEEVERQKVFLALNFFTRKSSQKVGCRAKFQEIDPWWIITWIFSPTLWQNFGIIWCDVNSFDFKFFSLFNFNTFVVLFNLKKMSQLCVIKVYSYIYKTRKLTFQIGLPFKLKNTVERRNSNVFRFQTLLRVWTFIRPNGKERSDFRQK